MKKKFIEANVNDIFYFFFLHFNSLNVFCVCMGRLPRWPRDKESSCQCGRTGSISGLGRHPGEGNGNSLQYSCLENLHGQRSFVGYSPWGQTCVWLFWDPMDCSALLYPSPSLGACSNSSPLNQWCHSTLLSSLVPFFPCLQSCPASGSFLMSKLFA